MPILTAKNLQKHYHMGAGHALQVLRGVDVAIEAGEMVAIMGSSGSGKSTLLHLLGALDYPTQGTVLFNNRSVFELSNSARDQLRCRSFGFVFQFYHLLPEFSVLENVLMPQMIRWSPWEWWSRAGEVRRRAEAMLERVGLRQRLTHRPNELSGGERQRVAIARALANEPAVLLADEPTGNLDKTTGAEVLGILRDLHKAGQTIVLVTHDLGVAQSADRVLKLEDGLLYSDHT